MRERTRGYPSRDYPREPTSAATAELPTVIATVAVRVGVAATTKNTGHVLPGEIRNPTGPYLHAPKPGHGIAGIRADIASGKLSMAALGQMRTRDIMQRYGIKRTQAKVARAYVSKWGLGGQYRDAGGHARTQPGPSTRGRA